MRIRNLVAALGVAGVTAAVTIVAPVAPAEAKVFEKTFEDVPCVAKLGQLELARPTDIVVQYDAPEEVTAGSTFTVTLPGGTTDLPNNSGPSGGNLPIAGFSNISSTHKVNGGTPVVGSVTSGGNPTINGTAITDATASIAADGTYSSLLPGPIPPGSLVTLGTSFQVVAGAAGTQITINPLGTTLTAHIGAALPGSAAATTCPVPPEVVATINVVNAPPPGAPDAIADTASTPQDNHLNIDVLANDKPNSAAIPIAPSTLAVSKATTSGALADPVDATNPANPCAASSTSCLIRYIPPIGFSGTDTFDYRICSVPDSAGQPGTCDTATVTVTVNAPAASAAATTVAPAATLPVTGSSQTTAWLAGVGAAILLAGIAMVIRTRSRKSRFVA